MKQFGPTTSVALVCLLSAATAFCQDEPDDPWPKEIQASQGTVLIYQPQPEKLEGNHLNARAAVALEFDGTEAPVFGAIWFSARLETDRADRTIIRDRFVWTHETYLENLLDSLRKAGVPE